MEDRGRLAARTGAITPFRVVEVMEEAWRLEAAGRPVIHLVAGEPDFGTPAPVVEAASRFIATGQVHYTESLGIPALRAAISSYYRERLGADVPASRVVVTTGASAALLLAFGATVDPGAEVLVSDPGYPCNSNLVRVYGGVPRGVPVGPGSNYQPDLSAVAAARTAATAGLLVGTPSNPTGTVLAGPELESLVGWCADEGLACYVDEVYGELVYDRAPDTALGRSDDVFVIGSFSKTFGMTGWRLGWLVCPDWALAAVARLAQNMYISPPGPAQAGAVAAFRPEVWDEVAGRLEVLRERRDLIVDGLRSIGFRVPVTPQGAFYAYADCSAFCSDSTDLVRRLLHEAGVAVAPGNDFGAHRAAEHVRFSYAAPTGLIEEALDRMARHLGRAR